MYNLPPFAATWLAQSRASAGNVATLVVQSDVLGGTQHALFNSGQGARDAVFDKKAVLATFDDEVTNGKRPPDAAERKRLVGDVAAAQRGAEAHATGVSNYTRVSSGTKFALDRVTRHVQELAAEAAEVEPASIKLPRGSTVESQRNVLAELDDNAQQIGRRIRPKEEAMALAQSSLSRTAERGRLRVGTDGSIWLPEVGLPLAPLAGAVPVTVVDSEAMFAWLHYNQLAAEVEKAIDLLYRDTPSSEQMTASAKTKALAQVAAQRFEVELVEVALVFAAWAEGRTDVGLRPDTDPNAILQIRGWKPGR